ncbi:amino acid ABC transporter substrate-binding protein [Streptomyces sp. SCSIO ZS0520]|uniref:amino acid ABC transporter substrate-binding protein n=1 Tax=Streptomyces sp. SCSIO ZS0520 TaxID=2892996 RepID=UPI0021D864AE|nr:amino acid ABC transporter substrate-binding protein [Streptomyces sp. SCSIO ZS0520]
MPRWKKILYSVLLVAALAAASWTAWTVFRKPEMCADGVEKKGGECIGVSAGGYDFGSPEIAEVSRAIARENARIADEPHVTVAMMLPLQSGSEALRRQMRSDLQGAYLGQLEANRGEGEPPRIRLVLANPGRNYGQWAAVSDTLVRMAGSAEDRLRAVTGFNLTLDNTEKAVERLTEHRVPVLAARISGDQIANRDRGEERFPGLARIIPTNHDAAQALADFNEKGRRDSRTVLVYDKRADAYTESLAEAFGDIEEVGPSGPAAMPFESPAIDEAGSTGNQFAQVANNICDSEADTVYFAGRSMHLRIFALKLAEVGCKGRHYTVISGSDAASLQLSMSPRNWEQLRGEDGRPKVSVQYAAPGHPAAWEQELKRWRREHGTAEPPEYLTQPKAALDTLHQWIADTGETWKAPAATPRLEDSRTMLSYDGLVTVGKAVHQAMGDGTRIPSREDVGNQWVLLQSQHRVPGTSGLICLTSGGNAYDKPAAVVELDPGEKGRGKLRFIGLGWPTGSPQPKNCVIPSGQG